MQIIPHVTGAIQDWLERVARIPTDETGEEADVCIIEVGGHSCANVATTLLSSRMLARWYRW